MTKQEANKPTLLAVGGPKHGEQLEDNGPTTQVMAIPPIQDPRQQVAAVAVLYVKRFVGGIDEDGRKLQRDVYVFQGVQNEQEMGALLTNYLLGEFIRGGYEVVEGQGVEVQPSDNVPSRNEAGAGPVAGEAPRTKSGLYLPN